MNPWSIWLRVENVAILGACLLFFSQGSASWWQFALLFLVPDLSILAYGAGPYVGAIIYNLAHAYLLPVMGVGYAVLADTPDALPYLSIWIAHIAFDRALGFGLKSPAGFRHTHLGDLGKKSVEETS